MLLKMFQKTQHSSMSMLNILLLSCISICKMPIKTAILAHFMGIKICTEICNNIEDYPVNLSHNKYTKYFTNPSK